MQGSEGVEGVALDAAPLALEGEDVEVLVHVVLQLELVAELQVTSRAGLDFRRADVITPRKKKPAQMLSQHQLKVFLGKLIWKKKAHWAEMDFVVF